MTSRSERIAAINATAAKILAERPALGEWCDVISLCHGYTSFGGGRIKTWSSEADRFPNLDHLRTTPLRMMYVGRRFVYDGEVSWGDEGEIIFKASAKHEVWLFVKNERENPVRAFPRHVRRDRQNDSGKEIEHGD